MAGRTEFSWSMDRADSEMSTGHRSADINRLLDKTWCCIPAILANQEAEAGNSQA